MVTVFFDIDGTLVDTAGAGSRAMVTALRQILGVELQLGEISFAGRTDRALVRELLQRHGMDDTDDLFARFCPAFLDQLKSTLPTRDGRVLPGVVEMLEMLSGDGSIRLGLITGNLRLTSRIKLDHFQLSRYFYQRGEPVGGFGDVHHERDDVARSALAELTALLGRPPTSDVWVVGDTIRDIACARAIGARVLAVGTGAYSRQELADHDPDLLLDDLTAAVEWVEMLLAGNRPHR